MSALADQIAEVLRAHPIRMDYNHPAWGNCYCGFRTGFHDEDDFDDYWWEVHAAHVAEKVAEALQLAEQWNLRWTSEDGETRLGFVSNTRIAGADTTMYTHVRRFVSPWTAEETKP